MKKILSLLLALMLLVAFAACSDTEDETEGAGAGTSAETQGTVEETEPATQAPLQSETEPGTQTQEPEQSETQTEAPATAETESIDPETTETTESTDDTTGSTETEGGADGYEPEDGEVLFFAPTLDGLLDDEYLKSACLVGARTVYEQEGAPSSEDFTYFLWDGEYLYACAVVYDDDIVTRGEKYVNEALNENPYCNDAFELWYTFDGDPPTGISMVYKACLDAFGYKLFSSASEGVLSENFPYIEYAATTHIDEENPANSYYICEFKFPCKDEFGNTLDVFDTVYFSSQVDDVKYGLDDVIVDVDNVMGQGVGASIVIGYANDYAVGVGHVAATKENNVVGFSWTDGRNHFPDLDTGDMGGYIELILLETTPEEIADSYADTFPTRLYELELDQ